MEENTRNADGNSGKIQEYKMSAVPRGVACVIEFEEFVNQVQNKRVGSQADVDNLTQMFQKLDFHVEHKKKS